MNISTTMQAGLYLKDYIDVLRRRRDVVVLFFITVVLVVTIGSFLMRPVYRATAVLLIDEESPNILTTSGSVTLGSQDYYSYREYYQSQIEIITSISIARRVFEELNLGTLPAYRRAKEPIKRFLKAVKVEPIRDTRLLKLHAENKDPALAAKTANRIAEIYVRRNLYYINRNELMSLLKNEYLKLETKLSENSKVFKEKHPEMIRLRQEMAEMAKNIERVKNSSFEYDISGEGGRERAFEGFKANNVSIQDPAEKPAIPIKPKKRLNILLAIIIGAMGGVGLAFLFEYLDDTIKSDTDIESLSDLLLLGNIPKVENANKESWHKMDLLVHLSPRDPVAEAYRAIRTSIIFSATEERPLKCIVITSPGPQDGKTTTLCNLGISMAQLRKKVLLVDGDLRKPRLHDIFGGDNNIGLSSFLCGQADLGKLVQKTDIENLFLVKGGPHPPNPSELIESNKLKEFVKEVKKEFDFVLFDSPPVNVVTDAIILSPITDGVILVAESGKTPKRALLRIMPILKNAKARLIGIILNKVSLTAHNYYYYSHYYGKK